jgi:hypothetical protein
MNADVKQRHKEILSKIRTIRETGRPLCIEFRDRVSFIQFCPNDTAPGEEQCEFHGGSIPRATEAVAQ